MDAFYASVEQRDHPELIGKPVLVGGDPRQRGAVASASCEASRYGIHPAMSMKAALRLCPQATRISPDFDKYRRIREQLHSLFHEYTDLIEPVAQEEAYLDVTYNKLDIPFGARVAKLIKADIRRELRLTASVGAAPNKFLARTASALAKPDGLLVVLPGEEETFLRDLPVALLPGVGKATRQHLEEMQICTLGQLADRSRAELISRLGNRGSRFWELARGRDDEPVAPEHAPRQISRQTTFPADVYRTDEMRDVLRQLAGELSARIRRRGLRGRIVTLQVRYSDFRTVTRSQALTHFIDQAACILEEALQLLERTEARQRGVRLLGVGLSGFGEEPAEQLDLFAHSQ